jgi:quercetin dioxygenase-like cupin family protein
MAQRHVFTSIKELPGKEITRGVTIRPLAGNHVMLNYVEFQPHAEVPTHSHPHEQLGLMIEGQLDLWVGDDRRTLLPGDTYVIPGGLPHGARAGASPALVLDVFYPLREDYLKLVGGAD